MLRKALGIVSKAAGSLQIERRISPCASRCVTRFKGQRTQEGNAKEKARPASLETEGLGESAKSGWGGDATAG
jgi:hypothetical protein